MIELTLSAPVDCIADFTYNFYWQHRGTKLDPDAPIPHQEGRTYTYRDVTEALKRGEDVHIDGDAGHRLCSSLGVDLHFFSGTGRSIPVGNVLIDGDVDTRMGISMVAGAIYVAGTVKTPTGNIIEVVTDHAEYRKFRSITDVVCNGLRGDTLIPPNVLAGTALRITDALVRDTVGARCACDARITVEGDVDLSTGILMRQGTVIVEGDAGMNAGALLNGGTVIIKGRAGPFAGIDMKGGTLAIGGAVEGYLGANKHGGIIYAQGAKALPPSHATPVAGSDLTFLAKALGISPLHAMMFRKYA